MIYNKQVNYLMPKVKEKKVVITKGTRARFSSMVSTMTKTESGTEIGMESPFLLRLPKTESRFSKRRGRGGGLLKCIFFFYVIHWSVYRS